MGFWVSAPSRSLSSYPEELVTENMASDNLVFLAVMFSFMCSEVLSDKLLRVVCQPAVGVVGQTVKISCSFERSFKSDQEITIDMVSVFKNDQEDRVFSFPKINETEDPRFKLPSVNNPSLELSNTAVTDEGRYTYEIATNRGVIEDGEFWISVKAKYSQITTSSSPEVVENGGTVDLYCNASGGYPAGAIHWFDDTNSNWTKSATMEITEGKDKLLQLSSKLSFTKIDMNWAPFRCVVLNNKFVKEEERTFQPDIKEGPKDASKEDYNKLSNTNIVAPVVVIGSLLVGLLLLILLRGRCSNRHRSVRTYEDHDVEKAINPGELEEEDTKLKTQKPVD